MKAIWNGEIVAKSDDTTIIENNHYFPEDSLVSIYFRPSDHTTVCGWKGEARYMSLEVNGKTNENAAWYYPEPKEAANNIKGKFAFWKGVIVES